MMSTMHQMMQMLSTY